MVIGSSIGLAVRDAFGFEFSGFPVSIQDYWRNIQLCVNSRGPLKSRVPVPVSITDYPQNLLFPFESCHCIVIAYPENKQTTMKT